MTGMSEVESEPPVVWPSWCYSGDIRGMTTVEGVKSERLSPAGSSSSRSGTPGSSYPGTPPTTSPTGLQASPRQDPPRNYSDFMRNLAAKYNNNHPNDYFSSRNGVKSGGKEEDKEAAAVAAAHQQAMLGLVPFGLPPMLDAALLSMVRAGQPLEGYLKRRPADASPLDLSAASTQASPAPPAKRPKKPSLSESLYGPDVVPLLRQARKGSPRPRRPPPRSPCGSACADKPCTPDSQSVAHWSVDDVVTFVAGVDMCSEYASNFKEQKIDGSSLSLLTEEHLTSALGMKLGPALKLRTVLASKLGQCLVCQHCVHCHSAPLPPPQSQDK